MGISRLHPPRNHQGPSGPHKEQLWVRPHPHSSKILSKACSLGSSAPLAVPGVTKCKGRTGATCVATACPTADPAHPAQKQLSRQPPKPAPACRSCWTGSGLYPQSKGNDSFHLPGMTRPAPAHLILYQPHDRGFVTSSALQMQKGSLGQAAVELGLCPALRDSNSQALSTSPTHPPGPAPAPAPAWRLAPSATPRAPPLPTTFQPGCISRTSGRSGASHKSTSFSSWIHLLGSPYWTF